MPKEVVSDELWAVIQPLLPPPSPSRREKTPNS
jgi:transposase